MAPSTLRIADALLIVALFAPAVFARTTPNDVIAVHFQTYMTQLNTYFKEAAITANDSELGSGVSNEYQRLFSPVQNASALRRMSDADLRLVFHAAIQTNMLGDSASYARDLSIDIAELEKRHIATRQDLQIVYAGLIGDRMFAQARSFAKKHKQAKLAPLPEINDAGKPFIDIPIELVANPNRREITRRGVDLRHGPRILVIANPMCHFARHGMMAINHDPALRAAFERYAVFLAPDYSNPYYGPLMFDVFQKWNRQHPREEMGVAYRNSDWSMVNFWGLPTFYFFKDGVFIKKLVGWMPNPPPKLRDSEGNVSNLKKALAEIGVIPQVQ